MNEHTDYRPGLLDRDPSVGPLATEPAPRNAMRALPDPDLLANELRTLAENPIWHPHQGDLLRDAACWLDDLAARRDNVRRIDRIFAEADQGEQAGWLKFLRVKRDRLRRELEGVEQLAEALITAPGRARATLGSFLWGGLRAQRELERRDGQAQRERGE